MSQWRAVYTQTTSSRTKLKDSAEDVFESSDGELASSKVRRARKLQGEDKLELLLFEDVHI